MKITLRPKRLFVLIFLSLFFSSPSLSAITYQKLTDGLEYAKVPTSLGSVQIHLLKVDLNKFRVQPVLAADYGSKVLSSKNMVKQSKALAVINANFFDKQNIPLGLVLKNGKIKNPFHKTNWWASLLIKGNHARISKVFYPKHVKGYGSGVQAGPRLVISGKVPRLKNKSSPKSAVGIDRQGKLILIATEGSLPIQDLANILAKPSSKGGVGLKNVLNLDGGSSSQLYVKVGDFEKNLPGLVKVPVGLGVFSK